MSSSSRLSTLTPTNLLRGVQSMYFPPPSMAASRKLAEVKGLSLDQLNNEDING